MECPHCVGTGGSVAGKTNAVHCRGEALKGRTQEQVCGDAWRTWSVLGRAERCFPQGAQRRSLIASEMRAKG